MLQRLLIPLSKARVVVNTPKKQGSQDRVMQARVCARGQETRASVLPRTHWMLRHALALWSLDTLIQMCLTLAEIMQLLFATPSTFCWRSVPVALMTADVQGATLKCEFQDEERVLYSWPRRDGPARAGVFPSSLFLNLKGVFGPMDALASRRRHVRDWPLDIRIKGEGTRCSLGSAGWDDNNVKTHRW